MKDEMRRKMLDMRQALSSQSVQYGSEAITERLLSLSCVQDAQIIMTYSAIKNEPDMWLLTYTLLDMGKQVALPCVTTGGLVAAAYCRDMKLDKGAYGIPQPAMGPNDPPIKPDLVIVPGVVFDLQGCRIGFGAGYYDRFLQHSEAIKVGVCYESQLVDRIEADPHDVCMDYIVTERRVLGET